MVESRRRTSILGMLALLGGAVGVGLTRLDATNFPRLNVAHVDLSLAAAISIGALAVAVIAFLASASSARTGTGLPMVATIVALAAVALSFYPRLLSLHAKAATPPPKPIPATPETPATPTPSGDVTDSAPHQRTIFDTDYPSSTADKPSNKPAVQSEPAAPVGRVNPGPAPVDPAVRVRLALAKVDAARQAALRTLESSPAYQSSKSDADQADTDLRAARLKYEPGSPELIAASQAALRAHSRLQQLISSTMIKDPASQAALLELRNAQSAGK